MAKRPNTWLQLLVLGLPVLILILAGIAVSAFVAVRLLSDGIANGEPRSIIFGGLVASLWLLMFVVTLRRRFTAA